MTSRTEYCDSSCPEETGLCFQGRDRYCDGKCNAAVAVRQNGEEKMDLLDELKALGSNVDEGLERFMGNAALYERMLKTLPGMLRKTDVGEAFAVGDMTDAMEKAHALKGVTGNLSITPLYEGYTKIVDYLRSGREDLARSVFEGMVSVQEKVIECIEQRS